MIRSWCSPGTAFCCEVRCDSEMMLRHQLVKVLLRIPPIPSCGHGADDVLSHVGLGHVLDHELLEVPGQLGVPDHLEVPLVVPDELEQLEQLGAPDHLELPLVVPDELEQLEQLELLVQLGVPDHLEVPLVVPAELELHDDREVRDQLDVAEQLDVPVLQHQPAEVQLLDRPLDRPVEELEVGEQLEELDVPVLLHQLEEQQEEVERQLVPPDRLEGHEQPVGTAPLVREESQLQPEVLVAGHEEPVASTGHRMLLHR